MNENHPTTKYTDVKSRKSIDVEMNEKVDMKFLTPTTSKEDEQQY